jgi:hypothetical protein
VAFIWLKLAIVLLLVYLRCFSRTIDLHHQLSSVKYTTYLRGRTYPLFEDIISYPYPGPKKRYYILSLSRQKKGYGYTISYILCQKICQHCHSFWTTKSQTWLHSSTLDFILDRIKSLIYQQRSKEMANHSRNGRNGSTKGQILPLKPKISGTEHWKKVIWIGYGYDILKSLILGYYDWNILWYISFRCLTYSLVAAAFPHIYIWFFMVPYLFIESHKFGENSNRAAKIQLFWPLPLQWRPLKLSGYCQHHSAQNTTCAYTLS